MMISRLGNRGGIFFFRGKSELPRAERWVIPSEGNLKESATEKTRPGTLVVQRLLVIS